MNTSNGQEIYYEHTHESQKGTLYRLVMLIPWQDEIPQPPELWLRNEGDQRIKVLVSSSDQEFMWLRIEEDSGVIDSIRIVDVLKITLGLDEATCAFLLQTWKGVFLKWKKIHAESVEAKSDSEKPSRRAVPSLIGRFNGSKPL